MAPTTTKMKPQIRFWWFFLISGTSLIALGIYLFAEPTTTYDTLSLAFALSFAVTGFMELAFSISNHKSLIRWYLYLIGGIFDLLIACVFFLNPILAAVSLPLFVGFWFFVRSTLTICYGFHLKKKRIPDWPWLLFSALAALLFSIVNIYNPLFGPEVLEFWTPAAVIAVGIFYIHLSLRIRKTGLWVETQIPA